MINQVNNQGHKYHPLTIQYHFDSEDDYRSGCRNVSDCHQQFFSELLSPDDHTRQTIRGKALTGRRTANLIIAVNQRAVHTWRLSFPEITVDVCGGHLQIWQYLWLWVCVWFEIAVHTSVQHGTVSTSKRFYNQQPDSQVDERECEM